MQYRTFGSMHWLRHVKRVSLLTVVVLAGLLVPGMPIAAQDDGPATLVSDLNLPLIDSLPLGAETRQL